MTPEVRHLKDWKEVRDAFDSFPTPRLGMYLTSWIFRGLKSTEYDLEPRIERQSKGSDCDWAALESMLLVEFQSKARMYMNAYDLPDPQDKPSWLALMQHYGVSTRLLDFSYSPYVALYFALRERSGNERLCDAALWALDATAVEFAAKMIFEDAERRLEEHEAATTSQPLKRRTVSLHIEDAVTDRDLYENNHTRRDDRNRVAVAPPNIFRTNFIFRTRFNDEGFVDLALPPVQNRRLSSQQGVFLFNGAERRTFRDSLFTMMTVHKGEWCRLFHVSADALQEAERRLFQMNIHDLALFPDMEGLAAFIRRRSRLHFAPQVGTAKG